MGSAHVAPGAAVSAAEVALTAVGPFQLGEPRRAPAFAARGDMGEVFRVDTDSGSWAVKVLFPWNRPEAIPADFRVQETAAAAGIPLPRPVRTSEGMAVVDVGDRAVRVYEWVDLAPPLDRPIPLDLVAEAGALLGRVHSLDLEPPPEPVDAWYTSPPSEDVWGEWVSRARGAGEPWADALADLLPVLRELDRATAAEPRDCITGHRDFDVPNVRPRLDDERALVVLDWENAGAIPAAWELASALSNWATDGLADPARVGRFLDAYRHAGGIGVVGDLGACRAEATAMTNYLRILVEKVLTDASERDHALPGLRAFLLGAPGWQATFESIVSAARGG